MNHDLLRGAGRRALPVGTALRPFVPTSSPRQRPTLRDALRASTEADHRSIDRVLSVLDLAHAEGYRHFLQIQLDALTRLSDRWGPRDREDIEALIGGLHEDLSIVGEGDPHPLGGDADLTPFHDAGIAYVVRGSRLGATILLRRVGPGLPTRYLAQRPSVPWPRFLAQLARLDEVADDAAIARSVASARAAFAIFARSTVAHALSN